MNQKSVLSILGIHFVLGMIALRGILRNPLQNVIGDESSDLYPHLWGYWRWIRKMNKGGWTETWSNTEPYLNVPNNGELYHVDWLNGMLVWMGTKVGLPFLLSVNIMIVVQWILLGIGIVLLCRHVGLKYWSTLFVVCALDTSPFMERFILHSAVFERLNLGWLLLYHTSLLAAIQKRRPVYILSGIVTFGLTVLSSWHYALFAVVSSIWIGLWKTYKDPTSWKVLLGLATGCASIAYPLSRRAQSSLETDSILQHEVHRFWDWNSRLEVLNDFTWIDFIFPRISHSFGFDTLEESIFIGWFILLGWIFFLWIPRKTTDEWMWWGLGLVFAILTLGPTITLWEGMFIDSPLYYLMAGIIPYFSTMEVPWEYSWMALLCGSIVCGFWMDRSTQLSSIKPWMFPLLVLVQNRICFPNTIAHTTPVHLSEAATDYLTKNSGYIFDFPLTNHASDTGQPSPHHTYLWYQTHHQRPIAYGIQQSWLQDSELWRQLNQTVPTATSWQSIRKNCKLQDCQQFKLLRQSLSSHGFTHFVMHSDFVPIQRRSQQSALWQGVFGSPIYADATLQIFEVRSDN